MDARGLVGPGDGRLGEADGDIPAGAAKTLDIFLVDWGMRSEGSGGVMRDPDVPPPHNVNFMRIFATGRDAHILLAQQQPFYGLVYVQHTDTGSTSPDTGVLRLEPGRNTVTDTLDWDANYFGAFYTTGRLHVRGDVIHSVGVHYDHALDWFYVYNLLDGTTSSQGVVPAIPVFSILSWTTD